ncbi:MAG: hypothetical protein RI556_01220 [Hydrogenovibrio sp.]|uniref:hypothetical protein n=1 Tax=Hydrogenovibrio sp. TaxID=2065821 RepID=UPI002870462C|nr:hypothetical protein [Hydrogenovibrio sp.]MDR9497767.1 hypothetical protein [Hydrogenovibrio sp.]
MIADNPAARLLAILTDGHKHQRNAKCRDVWYKLLEVEPGEDALLMSRLGKVMELPDQVIRKIEEEFPNQTNTYAHWSSRVNKAFFQQNLNGEWKSFIELVDTHSLNYLSLSADLIQTKSPTTLLDNGTLEELNKKVFALFDELMNGDFDQEFKEYLGRALQRIGVAIQEYRISGALPVVEAIEATFGHAVLNEDYRKELSSEFGQKVVSTLSAVASSVTIALGLPQLPQAIQLLIGKVSE